MLPVCLQAVITDMLTHDRPVLLLNVTLIVLSVRARARKSDLLLVAIAQERSVNEFAPVVGIQAQQSKRQQLACQRNRFGYRDLAAIAQTETLRPLRRDVRQCQSVDILSASCI